MGTVMHALQADQQMGPACACKRMLNILALFQGMHWIAALARTCLGLAQSQENSFDHIAVSTGICSALQHLAAPPWKTSPTWRVKTGAWRIMHAEAENQGERMVIMMTEQHLPLQMQAVHTSADAARAAEAARAARQMADEEAAAKTAAEAAAAAKVGGSSLS